MPGAADLQTEPLIQIQIAHELSPHPHPPLEHAHLVRPNREFLADADLPLRRLPVVPVDRLAQLLRHRLPVLTVVLKTHPPRRPILGQPLKLRHDALPFIRRPRELHELGCLRERRRRLEGDPPFGLAADFT